MKQIFSQSNAVCIPTYKVHEVFFCHLHLQKEYSTVKEDGFLWHHSWTVHKSKLWVWWLLLLGSTDSSLMRVVTYKIKCSLIIQVSDFIFTTHKAAFLIRNNSFRIGLWTCWHQNPWLVLLLLNVSVCCGFKAEQLCKPPLTYSLTMHSALALCLLLFQFRLHPP